MIYYYDVGGVHVIFAERCVKRVLAVSKSEIIHDLNPTLEIVHITLRGLHIANTPPVLQSPDSLMKRSQPPSRLPAHRGEAKDQITTVQLAAAIGAPSVVH